MKWKNALLGAVAACAICAFPARSSAQTSTATAPTDTLSKIVAVPNPWAINGRTFNQVSNLNSYGTIVFYNMPNTPYTIRIYDSRGGLVKTISEPAGNETAKWIGRNDDNQFVQSDVYVYVVDSPTLGKHIGKLIIIR